MARAKALIGLAGLCYWQGDWDAAEAAYGQARELAKSRADWWLELEALFGLAFTLACHRGELQAAAPIEQQFQAIIDEHPEPLAIGLGRATSRMMRLFAGDLDGSRAYGKQCLAGTRVLGERWYESQILRESLGGGLTVESGRWAAEHPRDAARRLLTDSEIDRAWAQGHAMSLEDAVAYARSW